MSKQHPPSPASAGQPPSWRCELRAGPLMPVPSLLRAAGFDPQPVLARCGLAPTAFDDADTRIDFDRATQLLEECARLTGRSDFGLLIGERFDFGTLGVVAQLMQNAPNVGAALADLRHYFHLQDRGAVSYLRDLSHGSVALGYALVRHDTPGAGVAIDTALAIGWRMLRALCGPRWRPTLVAFAHRAPTRQAAYRQHFGAPLQFDAAHSELQFDAAWLAAPIAGANAARLAAVRRAAERLDHRRERSFAERSHATAQTLVLGGRVSAALIAAALAMHERTLRRRLHAEGTSLKAIIGRARFEMACLLLRQTHLPLRDIAAALHYADATAFSRAFRQWAGLRPAVWRAAHKPSARAPCPPEPR